MTQYAQLIQETQQSSSRIEEVFNKIACKFRGKLAVVTEEKSISYESLNKQSLCVAKLIGGLENKSSDLIGICLDRGVDYVIGVIGILKSKCAFLTIDPFYPDERIKYIIKDSNIKYIITQEKYKSKFKAFTDLEINLLLLDRELMNLKGKKIISVNRSKKSVLKQKNISKNLAYVIYTSGSTGTPKGVMIGHQSVINLVQWHLKEFNILPKENTALFSSLSFDASIWELFPYLLNGNTIYICPDIIRNNLNELNSFYEKNKIKLTFLPTAVCELFLEYKNSSLRLLFTGGEELTKKSSKINKYRIVNNYGPTENTVVTTFSYVEISKPISIGRPIPNVFLYILNEKNELSNIDDIGELCISGVGLALGYLNNPELTSESFIEYIMDTGEKIKVYKTGDRVKRLANGEFQFLGRIDDQIKIRGYRIDILEIEKTIKSINNIKDCVVVKKNKCNGAFLIAYYVVSDKLSPNSKRNIDEYLKSTLQDNLPSFMIPQFFIKINSIPLTRNGKKDKNLLLKKSLYFQKNYVAPISKTESLLTRIWEELLEIKNIGIYDNFFELGAHSLICMRALLEIEKQFSIAITADDLYRNPCIEGLSKLCDNNCNNNNIKKPISEQDDIPLFPMQKQIWLLSKTDKIPRYNIPIALLIEGHLSVTRLIYCLKKLILRHESLRISIHDKNGEPIQKIYNGSNRNTPLEVIDHSGVKSGIRLALNKIYEDANNFIALDENYLFKVKVFLLSKNAQIIYFNFHHCIFDDWSLNIFYRDLTVLYNLSESSLPDLPVQYSEYAKSHFNNIEQSKYKSGLQFWKDVLSNVDHTLNITTDYNRPKEDTGQGRKHFFSLDKRMTKKIRAYVKKERMTIFVLFLSALYILFRKYTQQSSFCIGTVYANRMQYNVKDLIGCFINTVAIPIQSKKQQSIRELIHDIKETVIKAQNYQYISFSDIVEVVNPHRDSGRSPVFQVMLDMLNPERPKLNINNVCIKEIQINHNASVFDLSFISEEINDEVKMSIQYKTSLFKEETISRMAGHFKNILAFILKNDLLSVSEVTLLSKNEHDLILKKFSGHYKKYPSNKKINEIFDEVTSINPRKVAIQFGEINLTYKDLFDKSNMLANYLRSFCLPEENIIGIYLDKSPNFIISMLGILKAGYAYLPLDIEYPEGRIEDIVNDSSLNMIITTVQLINKLEQFQQDKIKLVIIDHVFKETDKFTVYDTSKTHKICSSIKSKKLAYVIYTSGSTGKPKGVMVEHRSVVRLVKDTNYVDIKSDDVIAQFSTLSFDAATFEIWGALLNGANLIIPQSQRISLNEIANLVESNSVSIIFLTSLLFKLLVEKYCTRLSSVRVLIAGGEAIYFKDAIKSFLDINKNSLFIHAYGPTENTTFTSCYVMKGNLNTYDRIPIGSPISNTVVYILDEELYPVPIGMPGILYVSGDGLSRGYLNNYQLTKDRFIDNPFSDGTSNSIMYNTGDIVRWLPCGNIEFIKRNDNQVKIHGFRIEMEEIQESINKIKNIKESVVISQGYNEDKKLIVYYTVKDGCKHCDMADYIQKYLKKTLPKYMIPGCFIRVPEMPITSNGKIDKNQLLSCYDSPVRKNLNSPINNLQKKLIKIWERVLKTNSIGIHDDFLDSGGSSLKNLLIVDAARQEGIYFDVQDIFLYNTIAKLSAHINSTDADNKEEFLLQKSLDPVDEIFITPSQRLVFDLNKERVNESNVGMSFSITKLVTFSDIKSAIKKLIDHHDVLRLRFTKTVHGMKPYYEGVTVDDCLAIIPVSATEKKDLENEICKIERQLTNSFDIEHKPLLKICLIHTHEKFDNNILLIFIHHLIIDAVSWRIFIEDLNLYISNPLSDSLGKTASYQSWSQCLNNIIYSKIINEQRDFWISLISQINKIETICDRNSKVPRHKEVTVLFSEEITKSVKKLSVITKTNINETLLSILYLSYKEWTHENVMPVFMMNNGRNISFHNISVVWTMGLFTIIYPIIFNNNLTIISFIENLNDINNVLRNIPQSGIGYCLLKYAQQNYFKNFEISKPDILFNYMGDFGNRQISELLTRIDDISNRNITQELKHEGISIVGMELEGKITMVFGNALVLKKNKKLNDLALIFKRNTELICERISNIDIIKNVIDPSLFIPLKIAQRSKRNSHNAIVFIPGQGGTCFNFNKLAQSFKLPFSVYGIQTYGLNEQETPFSTIERMAEYNIQLLKHHCPKGPYVLIGYSYGGTVAFEMTYQLKNIFQEEDTLVLIDAPPHQFSQLTSPLVYFDCAINYLNRALGLDIPIKLIKLKLSSADIPNVFDKSDINDFLISCIKSYISFENIKIINKLLILYHAQVMASYNFSNKSINKMTILLASKAINEANISYDMRERITNWQTYVNEPINYINIPGDHFSLLEEPYVGAVSKVLQGVILSTISKRR
jgi:amino acid adenylation domain-containing protein/non-ribosomal peptide synthase protein (TIGR01720 family)